MSLLATAIGTSADATRTRRLSAKVISPPSG